MRAATIHPPAKRTQKTEAPNSQTITAQGKNCADPKLDTAMRTEAGSLMVVLAAPAVEAFGEYFGCGRRCRDLCPIAPSAPTSPAVRTAWLRGPRRPAGTACLGLLCLRYLCARPHIGRRSITPARGSGRESTQGAPPTAALRERGSGS